MAMAILNYGCLLSGSYVVCIKTSVSQAQRQKIYQLGDVVNLKLIPPSEENHTLVERVGSKLSESAKYVLIGLLLMCTPLSVYNLAIAEVGYHNAIHWGFGAGLLSMWASSYLLFFSGWFIDLDW